MRRYLRRHLPALATALSLLASPRSAGAQAPTIAATTVEPTVTSDPAPAGMPIVHFVVKPGLRFKRLKRARL